MIQNYSGTGNRTPSCRAPGMRGGNVSRYTIPDLDSAIGTGLSSMCRKKYSSSQCSYPVYDPRRMQFVFGARLHETEEAGNPVFIPPDSFWPFLVVRMCLLIWRTSWCRVNSWAWSTHNYYAILIVRVKSNFLALLFILLWIDWASLMEWLAPIP